MKWIWSVRAKEILPKMIKLLYMIIVQVLQISVEMRKPAPLTRNRFQKMASLCYSKIHWMNNSFLINYKESILQLKENLNKIVLIKIFNIELSNSRTNNMKKKEAHSIHQRDNNMRVEKEIKEKACQAHHRVALFQISRWWGKLTMTILIIKVELALIHKWSEQMKRRR